MLTEDRDNDLPVARRQRTAGGPPIGDDSFAAELPVRPRRRLLTPAFAILLAAVALAGGFLAGVLMEKGQQESSGSGSGSGGFASRLASLRGAAGDSAGGSSATGGSFAAGRASFVGAGGSSVAGGSSAIGASSTGGSADFAGRPGGGLTVGQVAFVQKGTLYVTGLEGNTVKVTTSRASRVTKTVSASVKSIHPGETVVITGAPNAHGVVSAEAIRVGGGAGGGLGAGGLGALFAGRAGAGADARAASGSGRSGGSGAGGQQSGGEVALFGKGG